MSAAGTSPSRSASARLAFAVFASSDRVGANVALAMVLFSVAAAGLHGYRASFWTLPTLFLSETAAAAAIGIINCSAISADSSGLTWSDS